LEDIKKEILLNHEQKTNLLKDKENLEKQRQLLEPWGEFDHDKINQLTEKNLHFSFFKASNKEFEKFDFDTAVPMVISKDGKTVFFIVLELHKMGNYPFEKVDLPNESLSGIFNKKEGLINQIKLLEEKNHSFGVYVPLLEQKIVEFENIFENLTVRHWYEEKARGKIEVIKGWFPEKSEPVLLKFINENELGFEFSSPKPGDKIPVILKNKKYPKIFETITKIFQLPDYYEFDLTPFIAVFFPIFFAYCLGDAGYGVVLIIISIISAFTFFKDLKGMALLIGILGSVTTLLGILKSGTVFGIPITQQESIPFFTFLSQYVIITDDQDYIFNAFNVALMIGVVQIMVAIFISIGKKIYFEGFVYAIGSIGKLLIVSSIIVLFLGGIQKMELFSEMLTISKILLIIGLGLVLFFHDMNLPIARRIGAGILPLYFIITGLLGDVLSYIRLFALGVASSILGLVVNQIGGQMMDGSGVIGIFFAILFLIVGHSLNFLLACLGAFVHPLRLTFVEFYNNANFTGGGIKYKPFKKQSIENVTK